MGISNSEHEKRMREKRDDFTRAAHGMQPRDPASPSQSYRTYSTMFKTNPPKQGDSGSKASSGYSTGHTHDTNKQRASIDWDKKFEKIGAWVESISKIDVQIDWSRFKPTRKKVGIAGLFAMVSLGTFIESGAQITGLERLDLASRMKDRVTEAMGIEYKPTHVVTKHATPIYRENSNSVKAAYKKGDCVVVRYNNSAQSRIVHAGPSGDFYYSMIDRTAIAPLSPDYNCPNLTTNAPTYTTAGQLRKLSLIN
jgi:hypothetical protein